MASRSHSEEEEGQCMTESPGLKALPCTLPTSLVVGEYLVPLPEVKSKIHKENIGFSPAQEGRPYFRFGTG